MKYEKLDPISHIHHRPDMYVGSLKNMCDGDWVCPSGNIQQIVHNASLVYNPGLLRIFVEVLSNVIDNVWRSREAGLEPEKVCVTFDKEEGVISVTNDGLCIPFTTFKDTDIRVPELIFGHLLTSTNYNDQEDRLTSGRNGLGVKLTNVFSTLFEIELYNTETKECYKQKWENNMRKVSPPSIKSRKSSSFKNSSVCVRFRPDFEKFGLDGLTDDMLSLFYRYCIDMAMITHLPVIVNKEKIKMKLLQDYVKLYSLPHPKECLVLEKTQDLELMVCSSDNGYQQVVFTNGVYNKHGGVHCDTIVSDICRQLLTKVQSKMKTQQLSTRDIKQHLTVFLNTRLVNPEFSNQSKDRLLSPNIKFAASSKTIQTMMKWSFMEKIRESIDEKEMKTLKKMERKKVRVDGYDPANFAGTKRAMDCTLILCEGLSAKTYAVNGINVGWNGWQGRNFFGIYPMRGKCLNVRNANLQTIMNNKELMDIANILNLKYNTPNKVSDLNYGRVLILTDSDHDGIHIASLLLNYFDVLYPNLFRDPFIYMMLTPIAKVKDMTFYSENEYHAFLEKNSTKTIKVKYYKGLGTSSSQEVKDTFGKKVVRFVYDEQAKQTLNKVFHQKYAAERKEWMEKYDPRAYKPIMEECAITDFIDHELIRFSIDDCRRNIPNLFDGLKLSQRKILYAIFKKNLNYQSQSMKVAQLAGYVAEVSNYHHGEQCLFDTIIRMTHSFVGSNNIPLLYPDGQFGSRLSLGKDAANGRYIFTKLQSYTSTIFSKEDEPLLNFLFDDNDKVEPEYYMPILPMILVNGCTTGIGTGWSCSMPNYDPRDITDAIYAWIDGMESGNRFELPELTPFWKGFRGTVTRLGESKYMSHGIFSQDTKGKYVVSEIPVNVSTDKYKEYLETLMDEKKIKHLKNFCTTDKIHFEFLPNGSFVPDETNLKLTSTIHLTNMVLFGKDHKLQKFHSIQDIFEAFCQERYNFYGKRKEFGIKDIQQSIIMMENKARFLQMILSQEIRLGQIQDDKVSDILQQHRFDKMDNDYSYLLGMPVRQMSKTKLLELDQSIQHAKSRLKTLQRTSLGQLWKDDLNTFKDFLSKME